MEIRIKDIERLPEAAAQFVDNIRPGRVYAFYGRMGAGKTTFISEVCRQLGSVDEASSPTFSIVNVYETDRLGTVYHMDCYRLEDEEEAFDAGLEDYFNSGSVCFVEWPERIEGLLPEDAVAVTLDVEADTSRIVRIEE